MEYLQMTAPCGLACFNCTNYLANEHEEARKKLERDARLNGVPVEVMLCQGCRNQKGVLDSHKLFFNRSEPCYVYKCTSAKNIDFCYECDDFPCDHLHPHADRASMVIQYQGIQLMPDKENGAGILGKKQGGECMRGLFSHVVQPEISKEEV